MRNRSQPITTMVLVSVFLASITTAAGVPQTSDEQRQELLRDMAQVRAIGKSTELANLQKRGVELERKWFSRNKEDYGYMILEICGSFSSYRFKDDRQYDLARQFAILALEKSGKLQAKDKIPIEVELKLVTGHLQSLYKFREESKKTDWSSRRNSLAKLYLHAWDRLEKAIDPNFDPDEVLPGWPRPSAYDGIWSPGMSPEAIKDPRVRAEYRSALEEFWRKQRRYTEQRRLRRLMKTYLPRLQKDLLRLYSGPLFDSKELETEALQQDLQGHIVDKKTKDRILDTMKKSIKKQTEKTPSAL